MKRKNTDVPGRFFLRQTWLSSKNKKPNQAADVKYLALSKIIEATSGHEPPFADRPDTLALSTDTIDSWLFQLTSPSLCVRLHGVGGRVVSLSLELCPLQTRSCQRRFTWGVVKWWRLSLALTSNGSWAKWVRPTVVKDFVVVQLQLYICTAKIRVHKQIIRHSMFKEHWILLLERKQFLFKAYVKYKVSPTSQIFTDTENKTKRI